MTCEPRGTPEPPAQPRRARQVALLSRPHCSASSSRPRVGCRHMLPQIQTASARTAPQPEGPPRPSSSRVPVRPFINGEGFRILPNTLSFYKSCISHHLLIWVLLTLPVSLRFIFRRQLWADRENSAGSIYRHSEQNISTAFSDPTGADCARS